MSKRKTISFETTEHVRDHCLCLAAQRSARGLARRFDEAFRSVGLTSGQFSLLMSLNRPQTPSIGAVASLLAMDRTTLTASLKPLERRGLLKTMIDPADRRGRLLVLTGAGRVKLQVAMPIWEHTHAQADRLIAQTDPGVVRAGLRALA